jgi:hypothetical protein
LFRLPDMAEPVRPRKHPAGEFPVAGRRPADLTSISDINEPEAGARLNLFVMGVS